eukprot:3960007-Pleurochrysis_carterae.AAC.2
MVERCTVCRHDGVGASVRLQASLHLHVLSTVLHTKASDSAFGHRLSSALEITITSAHRHSCVAFPCT